MGNAPYHETGFKTEPDFTYEIPKVTHHILAKTYSSPE